MEKITYIMRGLPGSGKSTRARELALGNEHSICSADDYFMVKGKYEFNPRKLGIVHKLCMSKFTSLCKKNTPIVVCDNTNIRARDVKAYSDVAKEHGYKVMSVTIDEWDVDKCFARCTHDVPKEKIQQMKDNFHA